MFQSLEAEGDKNNEKIYVTEVDFNIFRELWFELDPKSTGMIPSSSVNKMIESLHENECRLGFDLKAKDEKTTTRLAAIHARCNEYDYAAISRKNSGISRISGKRSQNTVIVPAGTGVAVKRTVPFSDLLYILSSSLVPTDALDADGLVRNALIESRGQITLAAIKLQRWIRGLQEQERKTDGSDTGNTSAENSVVVGNSNLKVGGISPPPVPPEFTHTGDESECSGLNARKQDGTGHVPERLSLHQRRKSGGKHPLTGLTLRIPNA